MQHQNTSTTDYVIYFFFSYKLFINEKSLKAHTVDLGKVLFSFVNYKFKEKKIKSFRADLKHIFE